MGTKLRLSNHYGGLVLTLCLGSAAGTRCWSRTDARRDRGARGTLVTGRLVFVPRAPRERTVGSTAAMSPTLKSRWNCCG